MPDENPPDLHASETQRAIAQLTAERSALVKRNEKNNARIAVIDTQLGALAPAQPAK